VQPSLARFGWGWMFDCLDFNTWVFKASHSQGKVLIQVLIVLQGIQANRVRAPIQTGL
jgi:hypothetical protein